MDSSRLREAIRQGCVDPFHAALYHKDSPQPPAAPNYAQAATAQGAANVDTAKAQAVLNNPNIYTPYGSQTVSWNNPNSGLNSAPGAAPSQAPSSIYQPGGVSTYADGTTSQDASPGVFQSGQGMSAQSSPASVGQPTITQTLAPAQQRLLDAQNRISGNLANVAETGLNRVSSGFDTPFNSGMLNPISTSAGVNPSYTGSVGYSPLQSSYNQGGNIQGQINTSGVQGIPTVDPQARQHAEDLAYQAATSRLDPQWAQRNAMQDTQLRNQGLVAGGEAYDAAKRDQGYQQNDAYLQAQNNAVNQGLTNQQAQFGMGLAANQAGFGQAQAGGQFANAAQAQGNAQGLQSGQFANQANLSNFGMGQQNAVLGNQVGQQQFSQGLANANFGNQATQQQIQQQAYLRSLPLNELNSLRTGAQVQNPQFQQYSGSQIAPAPIFGAAQAQGTANQNLYNQQAATAGQFNSGLMSMAGTAAGGAMGGPMGAQFGNWLGNKLVS